MKKICLDKIMNLIKKNCPNYSKEKLEEIEYGLEGIYLTTTKLIIIFLIAYILNITKEMLILMIIYNIFRTFAFGLHATKSIYCLITSIVLFIGGTYLCIYININIYIKIFLSIICIICFYLYSPADTVKRPLINERKRKRWKSTSIILSIINFILILVFNKYKISDFLIIGMLEEILLIIPITYKIFKLPYDNYKNYKCGLSN